MILAAADTECYRDYWCCQFKRLDNGALLSFETYPGKPLDCVGLRDALRRLTLVTFNGIKYDAPMLGLALTGASCETLKRCSDFLIQGRMQPWDAERQFGFRTPEIDQIDMIEIAPGMVSLKVYMGRLHCPTLQDLPIDHDASIAPEQRRIILDYNINDLDGNIALYRKFKPQIDLRIAMSSQYGVDLRSKSDAQVAEAIFKVTLPEARKAPIRPRAFKFRFPGYLRKAGPIVQSVIQRVREADFIVRPDGYVEMPEALKSAEIKIGDASYRMGIGGLHSRETRQVVRADEHMLLVDRDVASYYPAIIIGSGLYPSHLGKAFLETYTRIRDERIAAKREGRTAEANAKKIALNGSFGKFGNPWSILYSPELLMQVTISGQLALLMLIEWLEAKEIPELQLRDGIRVVSANTDGIVIACPKALYGYLDGTIRQWESATGYETEETRYQAVYSRDVNSYIAHKLDGTFKLKGAYSESEPVASSWSSPHSQVCVDAVCEWIATGTPLDLTIRACDDITRFVEVRNVTGGAEWRGQYLGRAVRWYYSTDGDEITYVRNGNKVPNSDGSRPLMHMDGTMPPDIDIERYVRDAEVILEDIGLREPVPTPRRRKS